jgi:peptidyl-tRNA hydrolase
MQTPSYKVKLRAIQVVKQWFDRTQEPIVMSTAHLDALLRCIEEALQEGASEAPSSPPETRSPLGYA